MTKLGDFMACVKVGGAPLPDIPGGRVVRITAEQLRDVIGDAYELGKADMQERVETWARHDWKRGEQ